MAATAEADESTDVLYDQRWGTDLVGNMNSPELQAEGPQEFSLVTPGVSPQDSEDEKTAIVSPSPSTSTGCPTASTESHHQTAVADDESTVLSPATNGGMWAACLLGLIATLPAYMCVSYREWFIDELPAVLKNGIANGDRPWTEVFTHDFWGNYLFGDPRATHKSFRPVTTLLYRLVITLLVPTYPTAFALRLLGCAIHSLTTICVALLSHRVVGLVPFWSAVVALLFAVHPVHVENIVYVVGQADSLACLLGCLALLSVTSSLPFAVVLAVLSAFAKESGFTFLPLIIVVLLLSNEPRKYTRSIVVALATFSLVVFRWLLVGGSPVNFAYADVPYLYLPDAQVRGSSLMHLHFIYAKLLLLPWHQSWDYSYDAIPAVRSLDDHRLLGPLAIYALLTALLAIFLRDRCRTGLLGLGILVITFVPASNVLIVVGTVIGERLLYIPSVGAMLLLVRAGSRFRPWGFLVLVALSIIYSYLFVGRLRLWQTRAQLYEADALAWGRSCKTLHQYGTVLHSKGDLEGARQMYEASLGIFDDNAVTDYSIAQIHLQRGELWRAHTRMVKISNGHGIGFDDTSRFAFLVDAGYTLAALGDCAAGMPLLREGLGIVRHVPHALNALAICLVWQDGRFDEGVQTLMEAIQLPAARVTLRKSLRALPTV
ncbi:Protein O-mannosyl-transferase tmtc4 [Perkinsus olseni]|uniref:Protein O-mannosyl-transferase tmtc4 n=1 Tax=Perkinsus olseni TaxID=32597 RepID=A0A7J6RXJ3_PEROL|nr:Protein O-mannosyl-transferase tmtc4 [Perkinsus olseni]